VQNSELVLRDPDRAHAIDRGAVFGTGSVPGIVGTMTAFVGALVLTQLSQVFLVLRAHSSANCIFRGAAISGGLTLADAQLLRKRELILGRLMRR